MIDGTVFPDIRECFNSLIDGTEHLGETVTAVWHLSADSYDNESFWPLVLIYVSGGTEGAYDRVDRVILECYAPGTRAVETLESIKSLICGTDIETVAGYLDSIRVERVPKDVPFQSDVLNKAEAEFLATSRPL